MKNRDTWVNLEGLCFRVGVNFDSFKYRWTSDTWVHTRSMGRRDNGEWFWINHVNNTECLLLDDISTQIEKAYNVYVCGVIEEILI